MTVEYLPEANLEKLLKTKISIQNLSIRLTLIHWLVLKDSLLLHDHYFSLLLYLLHNTMFNLIYSAIWSKGISEKHQFLLV